GSRLAARSLHEAERAHLPLQVVLGVRGDEPGAVAPLPLARVVRRAPVPLEEGAEQGEGLRRRRGGPCGPAALAHRPALRDREGPVGSWSAAHRARGETRRISRDRERAQQEGVEYEPRVVLATAQGPQG